jgi:transcriptional regulator with XRE-family HTH domain
MTYDIDYSVATSAQIEGSLCAQLERIRLARNLTQGQLAKEAGVSLRTIGRMEKGQGISVDTFIRILLALGIVQNLVGLLPDPAVRPIERIGLSGNERKRARPPREPASTSTWQWGDEGGGNDQ